jgi:phage tail sheath protein FI
VIAFHNGKLEGDHYPTTKLNSSYAALFYPWVSVYDEYSGENRWLPPSGDVLAQFAYNDRVAQPWFATAGLNRGMLTSVVDLEVTLDEAKRDALYGMGNNINAIVNYKQQGFAIWGNKTLQRKSSALDRVNVRRMMNMARKAIAATSSYLVFEQNDSLTWGQWKAQVDSYLENILRARGLEDYRTKMDEETVTPYYRDRNEMPGKVWLKPIKTAEFIQIDFILTSSGAQFSD